MINFNIRCFEIFNGRIFHILETDKLQHKMFWNKDTDDEKTETEEDKLQHKMFWNRKRMQTPDSTLR